MKDVIIYHNPKCSKSREALEILRNHSFEPKIVEYLKTPLNRQQLLALRKQFELKDFVRTNEPVFKELALSLEDEAKVLDAMLHAPILMQRPIVVCNGHAVIARSPERLMELINR